jgi:hypothetical protein
MEKLNTLKERSANARRRGDSVTPYITCDELDSLIAEVERLKNLVVWNQEQREIDIAEGKKEVDALTAKVVKAEKSAERTSRYRDALQNIGQYTGEGQMNAPWQEMVRDLGIEARKALED